MALNIAQPSVSAPSRDEIQKDQNLNDSPHSWEMSSYAGNAVLDHMTDIAVAAVYQEDIDPVSRQQEGREKNFPNAPAVEESAEARLERLRRQRPEVFDSISSEIGFVFSISMSQVLSEYFVSGFTVILPTLTTDLHNPTASSTWPASAFSLTVASFLLIFGRLADIYGGYLVYVAGMVWFTVWSLIAGFSTNEIMLNFCRALQGLGPAAFLPSSVMILGSIYKPGPRKNLVFRIYGGCAPAGFLSLSGERRAERQ